MPRQTTSRTAQARLTIAQARSLALRAQGLARRDASPAAMLERVGAVQLDTISVLARSHELVAYARLGAIGRAAVEDAYWGPHRAFEYYAHANCILPAEAWPYFAFRRRAWRHRTRHVPSSEAITAVRARLDEGPVSVSDIGGARNGAGWWQWSDAKRALELLCLHGEAVCATRRGWKRIYDLPERALPPEALSAAPSDAECFDYLVARAGRALGVGTRRDIADYYRLTRVWAGCPPDARHLFDHALATSGLIEVEVEGWNEPAFVDPALLTRQVAVKHRSTLLSPFDSLVWERARTERLFGFAFLLEAYKPKADRVHGYFTMPLLARGGIAGHVDPARDGSTLVARQVTLDDVEYAGDLTSALQDAAAWVGCTSVRIDEVRPSSARRAVLRALG